MTGNVRLVLVAACALVDEGRVLMAERPEGKRELAGLWEFPGGRSRDGLRPATHWSANSAKSWEFASTRAPSGRSPSPATPMAVPPAHAAPISAAPGRERGETDGRTTHSLVGARRSPLSAHAAGRRAAGCGSPAQRGAPVMKNVRHIPQSFRPRRSGATSGPNTASSPPSSRWRSSRRSAGQARR